MREVHVNKITKTIEDLCVKACCHLGDDVKELLKKRSLEETSEFGKNIFDQIFANIQIAELEGIPLCQDTGMAVVFLEVGQDVHIVGGDLEAAVNEGVRRGYEKGYLRKSVLDPISRINTKDNTPAVIHTEIVPGDKLKIIVAPKGFGSENMSRLQMLKPSDGIEGVKDFILQTVTSAGANPCPPGSHNPDPGIAQLEKEMLQRINETGIGPQGLGGRVTALAVHIDTYPTHIAGLPVAVNLQCHVARHREAIL